MAKDKNNKNIDNSNWWKPDNVEKVMLWLTVITVLVSVVAQASSIVNNILQFDTIYMQLYPLLNIFHIYVLFYIISNLQNIKQFIPSPLNFSKEDKDKYSDFKERLKHWINGHFGEIYWKEWDAEEKKKAKEIEKEVDKEKKEEKKKKNTSFDDYVDNLTKNVNKNIEKTHKYFMGVFVCFLFLYTFELINSFTYAVNEPVLKILTMIFNNAATLLWFYLYLTFNGTKTTVELNQKNRNYEIKKIRYQINKGFYYFLRWFKFEIAFDRPNKFKKYEEYEEGDDEKYKHIEIAKIIKNWKFWTFLLLIGSIVAFIYFIYLFSVEKILEIEKLKDAGRYLKQYYLFRILSTTSIILGGCAMLATFGRLSSGFKRVPFAAFLVMVFYAAMQPLFFAGGEFSASNMKIGQLMFIANALCLIGKFGLLHLIKWLFANYHIAYYFVALQMIRDKKDELKLKELFSEYTPTKKRSKK